MTDYIINQPLLGPAKMYSTMRGTNKCIVSFFQLYFPQAGRQVYFYVFEHRPDFSKLPEWAGAFHGADIGFVFGAPFANISSPMEFFIPKYSEIEKGLSLYIMRLWTDFAKSG